MGREGKVKHEMWRKIFQYKKRYLHLQTPWTHWSKSFIQIVHFENSTWNMNMPNMPVKTFIGMQCKSFSVVSYIILSFKLCKVFPIYILWLNFCSFYREKQREKVFFLRIVFFSYKSHLINTQQNIDSSFFVLKVTSCLFLLSLQQASKCRPLFSEFLSFCFGGDLF